jgi:integrase
VSDLTLREFFEASYRPLKLLAKSPRTSVDYSSNLSVFAAFFCERCRDRGEMVREPRLSDLSDELLAEAMAWQLARGRKAATVNHLYRVVKSLWRFARRRKLIATLPDLDPISEPRVEPRTWTAADYQRIVAATAGQQGAIAGIPAHLWWRALILTIVDTGARITAAMRVRLADLDLERSEILLRSQNQKHRADQRIELQPAVASALEATLAYGQGVTIDGSDSGRQWLFPWPYDCTNTGDHWQTLRRRYKRMLRRAGLAYDSKHLFHNLRRFTATVVADARGVEAARDLLGHSDASVTQRYLDRAQMRTRRSAVGVIPTPDLKPHLRIVSADDSG